MLLRVHSIYSLCSMDTFLQVCWTVGMDRSVLMVYVPGLLCIVSNKQGKVHFRATKYWAATVSGMVASAELGVLGLRADLGCLPLGMESEQGLVGLRADLG